MFIVLKYYPAFCGKHDNEDGNILDRPCDTSELSVNEVGLLEVKGGRRGRIKFRKLKDEKKEISYHQKKVFVCNEMFTYMRLFTVLVT